MLSCLSHLEFSEDSSTKYMSEKIHRSSCSIARCPDGQAIGPKGYK